MESSAKSSNFFEDYNMNSELLKGNTVERFNYLIFLKRLIDILFVIITLPITLSIVLIFSIFIKIESPGPVFFLQDRVGFKGEYFKVIKLRSMALNAEKHGARWAVENDPRVTKVGMFIRKTRIDELPQLFNVLKGDMSLIGPRPERPMFTAEFNKTIPGFTNRLVVKPGLTGWAQINGGYDITPSEKLKLDLYYIKNFSFELELEIFVRTIKVILTGDGAR